MIQSSDMQKRFVHYILVNETKDNQLEAIKWFNSHNLDERAKLLVLLYELWQEQQQRILDVARGNNR